MTNPKISFIDPTLKSANIEAIMISPVRTEVGVVVLSTEDKVNDSLKVRIFSIAFNKEREAYDTTSELESYNFKDNSFARDFINHLPKMSAIELMFARKTVFEHSVY